MKLIELKGEKVRVSYYDGKSNIKDRKLGIVIEATKHLMVVGYEKYSESFNVGEIVAEENIVIEQRVNGQWKNIKGMIINGACRG